jgi:flagellar hook-length control protein FliK
MSKLSLLSVEISQSTDVKGSNANKPADNKKTETTFSDIIEQHNQQQKADSASKKVNDSGNDEVKAVNDTPGKLIEGVKDKTPKDEEHTLPVPIIYEAEHVVKAADVEGNLEALLITTSSVSVEKNKSDSNEVKKSVSNDTDTNGLLVDENKTVKKQTANVSNDDAIDLLKMLGAAEKLITKTTVGEGEHSTNAKSNIDIEKQKNNVEQNRKAEPIVKSASASSDALTQKPSVSNDEEINQAMTKQLDQTVKSNAVEAQVVAKAQLSSHSDKAATPALAMAEPKALAQMVAESTAIEENIIEGSSDETLSENEVMESELIANSTSSESDKSTSLEKKISVNPLIEHEAKVIDKTAAQVTNQSNVQSASQVQANQAAIESERVNDTLQAKTINPNSENSSTPVTKEQVQQAVLNGKNVSTSDESANESSNKNTDKANEEMNLAKAANEKSSLFPDKAPSIINQTLETGRPTMSAAETAAQQEQSFESVMSKLNTNATQTQKSITALNTETVAIYHKDFANAVKEKVMVMINQKIQQIDIQLDPPEMGNVHVRVNLQNEQAAVQFIVQNPQAKDALEQNMPKLRDMLAESGVDVGDANIEQRQPGEQSQTAFGENGTSNQKNDNLEQGRDENHQQVVNMVKASSTGVDYYA